MKRSGWNILVCVLGSAALVSCGTPGVPIPPSLELSKPVTDLRATRKGDKVFLAWSVPAKTVDRQSVRRPGVTRICRSLKAPVTDCKNPVAEISSAQFPLPVAQAAKKGAPPAPKVQANYSDVLPRDLQKQDPAAVFNYAVSVQNDSGRSAGLSNQVQVPSAPTLPPPQNFRAEVKSDGVLLSWDCPSGALPSGIITHKVRIYRHDPDEQSNTRISDAVLTPCSQSQSAVAKSPPSTDHPDGDSDKNLPESSQPEFLDQTFEWEKSYEYHATIVTVIASPGTGEVEVEGDDTPPVNIFAHDIYPPAVPSGLQAVFSGAGQAPFIDLVWSPNVEADLAGYNIFRHEQDAPPVKLNSDPVKTSAFRDINVQSGKRYFYSVSAVDERNNESAKSEEANEEVP
jgi:hypothetical protein